MLEEQKLCEVWVSFSHWSTGINEENSQKGLNLLRIDLQRMLTNLLVNLMKFVRLVNWHISVVELGFFRKYQGYKVVYEDCGQTGYSSGLVQHNRT